MAGLVTFAVEAGAAVFAALVLAIARAVLRMAGQVRGTADTVGQLVRAVDTLQRHDSATREYIAARDGVRWPQDPPWNGAR